MPKCDFNKVAKQFYLNKYLLIENQVQEEETM